MAWQSELRQWQTSCWTNEYFPWQTTSYPWLLDGASPDWTPRI